MIKLYIISLLLFPLLLHAEPSQDFKDVRAFVVAQKENQNSVLNQQIKIMMRDSQIPPESRFTLYGPELLLVGPQQKYHDCQVSVCKAYERTFFKQFGEIRFEKYYGGNTFIQIWRVAITIQILRIWKSDPQGQHLQILKNETSIPSVIFQ